MARKYKATLLLPSGEQLIVMVSRKAIVKLVGTDKHRTITERLLSFMRFRKVNQ